MLTATACCAGCCSFEPEGVFFRQWRDTVPAFEFTPGLQMYQITVPTVDTARFSYLCRNLLLAGRSVFLTGPSGTGKSVVLSSVVNSGNDADGVFPIQVNFSARTSSTIVQRIIESRLMKKHGSLLGPPPGKKVRLDR